MDNIRRIVGALLILAAIAIVAQTVIPGGRHDLWTYFNPLMAVSIVLVVAFSAWNVIGRARGAGGTAMAGGQSESNLVLYLGLFIAYLFFLNWFKELDEGEGHAWVWIVVNGMIPVLSVWAGVRLWALDRE
ncbi:MAG: hypothetical protein OXC56_08330 [Chloroflexi bacterium]|nr:hypothetical protein [Chloroflexota bacterium]